MPESKKLQVCASDRVMNGFIMWYSDKSEKAIIKRAAMWNSNQLLKELGDYSYFFYTN